MRVAVWYNLPSGGAKRALYDHVAGLVRRGHEVEAWCPPTADRSFLPLDEVVTEHVVPLSHSGLPPWWGSGRIGALRSSHSLMSAISSHCRDCATDMEAKGFDVYLISTCSFFGAPPIGRYLAGPTVLYLQEPHRWLYEAQDRLDPFPWLAASLPRGRRDRVRYPGRAFLEMARTYRRSQRARFEVDNAHAFDQILVNSLFSRETVLRIYGVDAEVCYLGIDTDMFRPLGIYRENMVLGVGALSTHKKAHLLVDAVAQMAQPRPRVEWVAPSVDDDYLSRVRADARRCGVDFVMHRRATNDVLVEALNRARALVYAPRLEPFGLVPLEANACELPVVAVAEGGVRETVIDGLNGLLVKPTPDDLAKALERLLHDPALAESMGQEGRRIVAERWSLDGAVTRLEKALLRLTEAESETRRIGYGTV